MGTILAISTRRVQGGEGKDCGTGSGHRLLLIPLPQAQDSTTYCMCVRDAEPGSATSPEHSENLILSAQPPKRLHEGAPQRAFPERKRKVTRTRGKEQLEKIKVAGEDRTILQFLVLGEGPIWEHTCSSEHCPGVLQHLREARLG